MAYLLPRIGALALIWFSPWMRHTVRTLSRVEGEVLLTLASMSLLVSPTPLFVLLVAMGLFYVQIRQPPTLQCRAVLHAHVDANHSAGSALPTNPEVGTPGGHALTCLELQVAARVELPPYLPLTQRWSKYLWRRALPHLPRLRRDLERAGVPPKQVQWLLAQGERRGALPELAPTPVPIADASQLWYVSAMVAGLRDPPSDYVRKQERERRANRRTLLRCDRVLAGSTDCLVGTKCKVLLRMAGVAHAFVSIKNLVRAADMGDETCDTPLALPGGWVAYDAVRRRMESCVGAGLRMLARDAGVRIRASQLGSVATPYRRVAGDPRVLNALRPTWGLREAPTTH